MTPDPDRRDDAPRRLAAVPPADPSTLDEADLMAAVARGDETAFAELYDRMSRMVYGVIRKVVRDPSQSEEVAQEVFVEVWRTATRFESARGR